MFLLLVTGVSSALAEDSGQEQALLPGGSSLTEAAGEGGQQSSPTHQSTDLEVAEELPHQDLDREEVLALIQGVFQSQLQAPAGVFDGLEVDRFLAPNVAIVADSDSRLLGEEAEPAIYPEPSEDDPLPAALTPAEERGEVDGAYLLNSSLPLRVEGPSGEAEVVDLGLEHREGELQPSSPLVDVGVPKQLGEGIELADVGIQIGLVDGPQERAPSTVEGTAAVYPNVAEDTDLVVAPTPTGVETLTHVRTADAPRSQRFTLDLPAGSSLRATSDGGAEVWDGEKVLMSVSPPTAIDADGGPVPVEMSIEGNDLTLTVAPDPEAVYPILVDPLFQTYQWSTSKYWQSGICNSSIEYSGGGRLRTTAKSGATNISSREARRSTSGSITTTTKKPASISAPARP